MTKKNTETRRVKRTAGSLERVVRPLAQDLRSPIAKARDKWLVSAEGQSCRNWNILSNSSQCQYLENRLICAFIAGANWAAGHLAEKKRPNGPLTDTGERNVGKADKEL